MKNTCLKFLISTFLILSLFIGCKSEEEEKVLIAAAANMQFVTKELIEVFSRQTGVSCELIIASSGKITAQIKEGAPYDIFLSADMKYPTTLFDQGLTSEPPKVYAYGQLILWSMNKKIVGVEQLADPDITKIAIANPKIAPYGKTAIQVLNYYDIGEITSQKLVYGESIAQANQFIISDAVDAGFTSKSVVLSHEIKNRGTYISIPQQSYQPIEQGAVLINRRRKNKKEVGLFYDFLFSAEAHKILKDFGYLLP